jgi:hypothetical protein
MDASRAAVRKQRFALAATTTAGGGGDVLTEVAPEPTSLVLGLIGSGLAGAMLRRRYWPTEGAALAMLVLLVLVLAPEHGKAFIYFQF